jgi:hypothetical protein
MHVHQYESDVNEILKTDTKRETKTETDRAQRERAREHVSILETCL